jgi:thioredoxin-dependent peroxiredoxin
VEASGFRDAYDDFKKRKVVVLGVSPDPPAEQKKFHEKFNLPFDLLCDTEKKVAEAYGVLKEKSMYGKTFLGIERTTFLIDISGKVSKVFEKVKADGHAQQVLAELG